VAAVGDEPAFPDDAVEIGRVVGAWGVKGAIKVKPHSVDPQALFSTKRWFLQAPLLHAAVKLPAKAAVKPALQGAKPRTSASTAPVPEAPRWPLLLRIIQAREQGDHVVATVQGLDERDGAEVLSGARIFVSRTSFPTPQDDEFYWVDLIGLAVQNREGLELGEIVGLVQTGPSCVLRVAPRPAAGTTPAAAEAECLIPFVSHYVDRVDLPGRCVWVDWQLDY
jgi:16S rRNA processing protein RimM